MKIKNLRRVLIWEVIRYWPPTLYILEATCAEMKANVSSDVSYIHYFLEDMYKKSDVR